MIEWAIVWVWVAVIMNRSFAHRPSADSCYLMGLAYAWQELPAIQQEAWDVPLHAIATEKTIINIGTS